MEKLISNKRYLADPTARTLLETLDQRGNELGLSEAIFYYDFPSFRDYEDDTSRPNALILSRNHGILALNFCDSEAVQKENGALLLNADAALSQFFSILFGRLIKSRLLRRIRNELAFPFHAALYSPGLRENMVQGLQNQIENTLCNSFESLAKVLADNRVQPIEDDIFLEARSIIEGAKALNRPKPRDVPTSRQATKAHILAALEAEIANFDAEQRKAAITLLSGPERIRGLAGTGKTIVLAMKAAQLHLDEPTKRILYTFYTKSLYDLIRILITRFYRHYKDADPDWDVIRVLHAWGGSSLPGVYHRACIDNNVPPLRWQDVPPNTREPFGYVCADLLRRAEIKPAYDFVLIDEGQDMPEDFFKLCFRLTPGDRDNKNIVWAYDELQNIFDVKVRSPQQLFGHDENGEPLIDLERASTQLPSYLSNDIILYKSYRNPKEVLITAHALGFGLYSEQIVQMLENKEHWEDIGYSVVQGEFTTGSPTIIERPDANSPLALSKREAKENIIQYFKASSIQEELNWIIQQILQFINEGLRPEDILVISLDDRNARRYFDSIQSALLSSQVQCTNILDNPYSSSRFAVAGAVTLSTVHRAKGNEAAAVIATGIDALYPLRKGRTGRNRIFTAFTRTKAWLRVCGVGDQAAYFLKEVQTAIQKSPRLEFDFPDLAQVSLLQRDMSKREAKLLKLREKLRKELKRLGLQEEDMAELFLGEEKK